MNHEVLINDVNVSNFTLNFNVQKKASYLGSISSNQGTLILDATRDYDISVYEEKSVVIKDFNDNTIFTGITLKGEESKDKKTFKMPFRDKWYYIQNTACSNKTYKNQSFKTIVEDIIGMSDETSYNVADPTITVPWFAVTEDDTVKEILGELSESIGAECYYDSAGVLQFSAGYKSSFSTSVVKTFSKSNTIKATIEELANEYDYSQVSFVRKEFKDNSEIVYIGAKSDDAWLVPAEGVGVDDEYFVKLDKKIYELGLYSEVEFDADAELSFDSTVYNSNFQSVSQPCFDEKVKIKIPNSATITKEIRELEILGKAIREINGKSTYSTGNNVLTATNDIIDNGEWAGDLAKWRFEKETDSSKINLTLAELFYNIDIGDKFNFDEVRYIVDSITFTEKTIKIIGKKDRGSAFVSGSYVTKFERDSEEKGVYLGDGVAPTVPTNFSATDSQVDYKRQMTVSWDASVSEDVASYMLEIKKVYETWYQKNVETVRGLSYVFDVEPLTIYDFRIKAVDIEDKESSFVYTSRETSAITGDGSDPDPFVFDGSECSADKYSGNLYAHLKWKISGSGIIADDIKHYIIRCFESDLSFDTSFGVAIDNVFWEPEDFESEKTFDKEVDECFYEVDETKKYAFVILVEDWDGNIAFVPPSNPFATDDSIIRLDFASYAPTLSYVPTITAGSGSGYALQNWNCAIPTGVSQGCSLEFQYYKEKTSLGTPDAETDTISFEFDGSKIFPLPDNVTVGVSTNGLKEGSFAFSSVPYYDAFGELNFHTAYSPTRSMSNEYGKYYYLRARFKQGAAAGSWSSWCKITA